MKKIFITLFLATVALVSCEKYDTVKKVDTDFKTNFEAFWTMVDEQYCYLDYKNIDWKAVHDELLPRVEAAKTEQEFFNILGTALDHLRDGHVWMESHFKSYSCDTYHLDENGVRYPANYSSAAVKNYVTEMFHTINSNTNFGFIERDGRKFAYIYYSSFDYEWKDNDYKYIEAMVKEADGVIFDIRNNPGGSGILGIEMAGMFFNQKTLVGYHAMKNGVGHNDFTEPKAIYVKPSTKHNWTSKKTMLLTNRDVYSTANLFTSILKHAPNVTQIGGISGGGGAMPMTHILPNGWFVIFPANVLYDSNKQHIENGIAPDIEVTATVEELREGKDAILERAIEELLK